MGSLHGNGNDARFVPWSGLFDIWSRGILLNSYLYPLTLKRYGPLNPYHYLLNISMVRA